MSFAILIILVFFVVPYFVLAPIAVYRKHRTPVNRDFFPLTDLEIASCTDQKFAERIQAISALGFEQVANLQSPAKTTRIFTTIFYNYQTLERANVTEISVYVESPLPKFRQSHFMEFNTEYADGDEINTNNSHTVGFINAAGKKKLSIPGLEDASTLYRIHQNLTQNRRPKMALPEDAAQDVREGAERSYGKLCEMGIYRLDESAGCYRLTVKGTLIVTMKLQQPIRAIRGWLMHKRAGRLMASLETGSW